MNRGRPRIYSGTKKERAVKAAATHWEKNRQMVADYKSDRGCVMCGEKDPVVLDLDHIDPSTKRYKISEIYGKSVYTIWKEIEKCQVLCANCHRRKTAANGDSSSKVRDTVQQLLREALGPGMGAEEFSRRLLAGSTKRVLI